MQYGRGSKAPQSVDPLARTRVDPFGRTEVDQLARTGHPGSATAAWIRLPELRVDLIPRAVTRRSCRPTILGRGRERTARAAAVHLDACRRAMPPPRELARTLFEKELG